MICGNLRLACLHRTTGQQGAPAVIHVARSGYVPTAAASGCELAVALTCTLAPGLRAALSACGVCGECHDHAGRGCSFRTRGECGSLYGNSVPYRYVRPRNWHDAEIAAVHARCHRWLSTTNGTLRMGSAFSLHCHSGCAALQAFGSWCLRCCLCSAVPCRGVIASPVATTLCLECKQQLACMCTISCINHNCTSRCCRQI